MSFKKDYDFGIEGEYKIIEWLKSMGYKVEPSKEKMSILDFIITNGDRKVNIELKSRRCTKDKYANTLIGANKLGEARNKFYKNGEDTLFFFSYTDGLYYINPFNIIPEREFKLQRFDRGIDSIKGWLYYNINDLILIYKND